MLHMQRITLMNECNVYNKMYHACVQNILSQYAILDHFNIDHPCKLLDPIKCSIEDLCIYLLELQGLVKTMIPSYAVGEYYQMKNYEAFQMQIQIQRLTHCVNLDIEKLKELCK